ncbi:PAP2 superfamily protein [Rubripirellula tenax]|uniref:PAP2 superfamily protein n=1 Tax=Rubripirellula tenax TaxID=2528015 RepID=A0A5C6EFJ7_9BACT|nr:phosphatase PAP2 family protein [Rubripirellula tenax]TWU47234.1 PAP2 superfamily protein [Rubripirellula tenax]
MTTQRIRPATGGTAVFGKPIAEEVAKFRMATLLWMAGITILMVPLATLVDVPISRWFSHAPLSKEIGQVLDLSSYYAHGTGVFLILLGVIVLAPTRRWYVPRLATLAMGAGAVATLTKMFVLRPRPNSLNLDAASYDFAWVWSFDWSLDHIANFDASTRAFPSASLATAAALTVGLWVVLPLGRWMFVMICIGTMLQRLACGAHFVSDLFGSASIGLAWAFVCFHPAMLGSLFDKMEPDRVPRRRSRSYGSPSVRQSEGRALRMKERRNTPASADTAASDEESDRFAA